MEKVQARAPETRDRILDAAEQVFARDGFAGAGMKSIARTAEVAQGLLHYHFSNKEGLYAAVIARRSGIINAERRSMLTEVDLSDPDAVTQVMYALMVPPLGPAGGGRAYARIFAGLVAGEERDAALVAQHYDPTARLFIDALQQARPHASRRAIAWGYSMAIGVLVGTVAGMERANQLGDADGAANALQNMNEIVAFATGGFEAAIATEVNGLT